MRGLKSVAASHAAREPADGRGMTWVRMRDLHGVRRCPAAARVADCRSPTRAGELDADAGRVVQLGLQDADGGVLLHGVEHDHGGRPAADLEEGERLRPIARRCCALAQTMPRFFIS